MKWISAPSRKSLLGRVLGTNLFVAGASVVSLTALFLVSDHSEFRRQQLLRVQMLAQFVARQSEVSALVGDGESIDKIVASALATEDVIRVGITYRGNSGEVSVVRNRAKTSSINRSLLAAGSWLEASEEIRPIRSGLLDWDDASAGPASIGKVSLRISLEKQESLFERTLLGSIAVAGILIFLITLVQSYRVRKLLRPLESLIAFTRRIGAGNLQERACIHEVDEIADVAVAFNQMLDRLGQTTVSRDYVDNIIISMAECLFVVRSTGRIETVNDATVALLGYSQTELVGKSVSLVGGDEALSMLRTVSAVECTWQTKDARLLTVLLSSSALRGNDPGCEEFVWLAQDVTERRRTQEELLAARERYSLAVAGANDGIWDWNVVSEEVYYSPRWTTMLGYEETAFPPKLDTWLNLLHPEDRASVTKQLDAHRLGESKAFESEHRMRHHDGTFRWMLSRGLAVRGDDGLATRIAGSQTDITNNKVSDPLTGLPNRVLFNERINQAFETSRGQSAHRFAVLFLDLDRFKIVNDSLGHLAGDELLIGIAQRLREGIAASAGPGEYTIARLSGDEFAILIEGIIKEGAAAAASRIGAKLIEDLSRPFLIANREVFTSVSIGIAVDTGGHASPAEILRDADTAMYRAKALGKSRCELFDADMRAQAVTRLELDTDLRKAIERNEFIVYYQPKFSIPDKRLEGFEALVRWQHPTRGQVPPSSFIPVAEETGMIIPIGAFVLREACRQMREWQLRRPEALLTLSVNISPRQFMEPALLQLVADTLVETNLPASTLFLEVTEDILIGDADAAVKTLHSLKSLGVRLKIDDFGSGYSSLNYLHRYPFDTVKIDRTFIANLESTEGSAIVKAIINLSRDLGMEVTAEGVETEQQLRLLDALGCKHGQGYYFSCPVPPDQAEILIARSRAYEATESLLALEKGVGFSIPSDAPGAPVTYRPEFENVPDYVAPCV